MFIAGHCFSFIQWCRTTKADRGITPNDCCQTEWRQKAIASRRFGVLVLPMRKPRHKRVTLQNKEQSHERNMRNRIYLYCIHECHLQTWLHNAPSCLFKAVMLGDLWSVDITCAKHLKSSKAMHDNREASTAGWPRVIPEIGHFGSRPEK